MSDRENDTSNGENAPAWALVLPAVNVGANAPPHRSADVTVGTGVASGPEPGLDHGCDVAWHR